MKIESAGTPVPNVTIEQRQYSGDCVRRQMTIVDGITYEMSRKEILDKCKPVTTKEITKDRLDYLVKVGFSSDDLAWAFTTSKTNIYVQLSKHKIKLQTRKNFASQKTTGADPAPEPNASQNDGASGTPEKPIELPVSSNDEDTEELEWTFTFGEVKEAQRRGVCN
jgi:hypothetical protein